jgi:hypothetical protein
LADASAQPLLLPRIPFRFFEAPPVPPRARLPLHRECCQFSDLFDHRRLAV